ncbi:MAG: hypothetical protein HONBIEJF_00615 [Fimbriimonadaceae bacterium]|nr:hypothetical protein [Fimbriimonadaceae bacterium]
MPTGGSDEIKGLFVPAIPQRKVGKIYNRAGFMLSDPDAVEGLSRPFEHGRTFSQSAEVGKHVARVKKTPAQSVFIAYRLKCRSGLLVERQGFCHLSGMPAGIP